MTSKLPAKAIVLVGAGAAIGAIVPAILIKDANIGRGFASIACAAVGTFAAIVIWEIYFTK